MSCAMELDKSWDAVLDPGKATDYFATSERPHFDPTCAEWNPNQAWWCSEISRAIYRRDNRDQFFQQAGLRERRFFDEGSAQASVVTTPEFCILVFRGTADLRDWITNVRIAPTMWPAGGRVHEGFARAATRVHDAMAAALASIDLPTFVTGHSLGGALATLAMSQHPFVASYTFGAPRVGDAEFWQTITQPLYRVVNNGDLVPSLPPRRIGYRHGGTCRHLATDGSLQTATFAPDLDDGAEPEADDSIENSLTTRRWYQPPDRLSDHAPINYSSRLLQLAQP